MDDGYTVMLFADGELMVSEHYETEPLARRRLDELALQHQAEDTEPKVVDDEGTYVVMSRGCRGLANKGLEMRSKRGSILVMALFVVAILAELCAVMLIKGTIELKTSQLSLHSTQAFHLAEGATDDAWAALGDTAVWNSLANGCTVPIVVTSLMPSTMTNYSIDCAATWNLRRVVGTSTVNAPTSTPVTRRVEIVLQRQVPADFFDYVVYSSGEVVFNGHSYQAIGNILTGYQFTLKNTINVTGKVTYDPNANPLPQLDFAALKAISQAQNNVYDAVRLQTEALPTSFWYKLPTDPNDSKTGIPNVVLVESDLTLKGKNVQIGGVLLVVGNLDAENSTAMKGNINIDGVVYTTGDAVLSGGGSTNININGAVYAGGATTVDGSVVLNYQQSYLTAFRGVAKVAPRLVSWRQLP